MTSKRPKTKDEPIELRPDGWERFERAVDVALKMPAKHRVTSKPKTSPVGKRDGRKVKSR